MLVLALLGAIIVSLLIGAAPALKAFGFNFLPREWNPVTEKFGALAPIYGTVVTSIIAMLITIPIAFGIAVFLTGDLSALAADADRDRDRAARRDPEHRVRHLGLVRPRADPSAATRSPGSSSTSARPAHRHVVSRARRTASAC